MDDDEKENSEESATTPAKYLRIARAYIRNAKLKEAFRVLQQAVLHYPDEPLLLSYFGLLQVLVDKKHRSGVENCKKAIVIFGRQRSPEKEKLYPVFYLNLGKAYATAGKKKDAIDAFTKGLKYDSSHHEIKKELRGMGVRKEPPVPFLERSNPINKLVGKVLRGKKAPAKNKGAGAK